MYDLCDLRRLVLDLHHVEQELKETTGLSLNEALCLCQADKGVNDPGKLAAELELSPSRLSRILDSLQNRGLLGRRISQKDRRIIAVELTEEGRRMILTLHSAHIALPRHLEKAIDTLHEKVSTGENP